MNSFVQNVVMVVCVGDRETEDCYDWDHIGTGIF